MDAERSPFTVTIETKETNGLSMILIKNRQTIYRAIICTGNNPAGVGYDHYVGQKTNIYIKLFIKCNTKLICIPDTMFIVASKAVNIVRMSELFLPHRILPLRV